MWPERKLLWIASPTQIYYTKCAGKKLPNTGLGQAIPPTGQAIMIGPLIFQTYPPHSLGNKLDTIGTIVHVTLYARVIRCTTCFLNVVYIEAKLAKADEMMNELPRYTCEGNCTSQP